MVNIIRRAFLMARRNPLLFLKRLWLILRALFVFGKRKKRSLSGVHFEFDLSRDPNIKRMYVGSYEMEVMRTMKEVLQRGDTFIDVGANIGYLSAVAASLVGKERKVYSFEPVPRYFSELERMHKANSDYFIQTHQIALGEREGIAPMHVVEDKNIGNSTMIGALLAEGRSKGIIQVPVRRLDGILKEQNIANIKMIKIDVEGFEFAVLKGLGEFFEHTKQSPSLVCEICPEACVLQGYTVDEILNYMSRFSYIPYDPFGGKRVLTKEEIEKEGTINVWFQKI